MLTQRSAVLALAFTFCCLSCATLRNDEDISDYKGKIAALNQKLIRDPNDAESLRDLGEIFFQVKQYPQAIENLKKSYEIDPNDAKTVFYYGMTLEYHNNPQAALSVYINYSDFSSFSPYRHLIEGRYQSVTSDIVHKQFQTLLTSEQELAGQSLAPGTMAVFPLSFQGADDRYAPLGKGLSEMLISDLGRVKKLTLVERTRIEALLQELDLVKAGQVDPSTAPRLGKLLGAGRIVTGSFSVSNEKRLTMSVGSWDVFKKDYPGLTSETDELSNLFRLEKEFVFDLIKGLGITLTTEERDAIQQVPTNNLQAFLLYSIGLEKQDAGDFDGAAVYFNNAASLDPDFIDAKNKSGAAEALVVAGGDKKKALIAAQKVDVPIGPDIGGTDLVMDRLQNLGNGIGSNFYPGQDDRKPAQEASSSGQFNPPEVLPPPPPPPHR